MGIGLISLLLLAAVWCWGAALLRGKAAMGQLSWLAYPVGYAALVLISHGLWLLRVPVPVQRGGWLGVFMMAVSAALWQLVPRIKSVPRPSFSPAMMVSWAAIGGVLALGLWSVAITPGSWDNVALYGYRAQRIAEGWMWQDFTTDLVLAPADRWYAFTHPFGSSVAWAIFAGLGGAPATMSLGLVASLLLGAWQRWKSWQARAVMLLALMGNAAVLQAATENYPAWPVALMLVITLLAALELPRSLAGVVSALFLASTTVLRVVEPYWLLVLVFVLLRVPSAQRRPAAFFASATLFEIFWWVAAKQQLTMSGWLLAAAASTPLSLTLRWQSAFAAVMRSPVLWQGVLTAALTWMWLRRHTLAQVTVWFVVLHAAAAAMAFLHPLGAPEALQAFSRASLPLYGGFAFVWAELIEYNAHHATSSHRHPYHPKLHARQVPARHH